MRRSALLLLRLREEGKHDIVPYEADESILAKRIDCMATDMNRQDAAPDILRQSDERFRALIQHSADAIQLLSADGTVLYSSDSVERVLGYKPEEIQGTNAAPYLHPDDLPRFMEKF